MAVSRLMKILIDAENRLGWTPKGNNLPKARAAAHGMLTRAMTKWNYTEYDLELALAYCVRKHIHLENPLGLIVFVESAREVAVERDDNPITRRIRQAVAWECDHVDDDSDHWIGRLVRSLGPYRERTLTEWHAARKVEN